MAIAIKKEIIIIDPNAEVFYSNQTIEDVLERYTDWIVVNGKEERYVFQWDDDLLLNADYSTFDDVRFELEQIAERKDD